MSYNKYSKPIRYNKATNVAVSPGTIKFRLLCDIAAAGGLIGRSGSIIKELEYETSSKIRVDDAISTTSKERLVHVIGTISLNRKFWLSDEEEVAVSAAQEGLIRVFDRTVEVNPPVVVGGTVRCRLLVGPGTVGAVMGAKAERVNKISRETGVYIKIIGANELVMPCARPSDEMILITGGSLAVKKALYAVSRYIQQKTLQLIGEANAESAILFPSMKMETGDAAVIDRGNERVVAEVVFKLLCTWNEAGAVIGFKGRRVKALEEETGASILLSPPGDDYNQRVLSVSAFENRKSNHSTAQNALARVFNEMMSLEENENVTARLLIQPDQLGCLNILRDSIKETGATLQILEQNYAYAGASTDEKVIQINGDNSSVQIALFQVTWMLRECAFGAIPSMNSLPLLPHKLFNLLSNLNERAVLTEKMKNCRVTKESNGSPPSKVWHSEVCSGRCLSANTEPRRDLTTVNSGPEHDRSVIVTNTKMEIAVRADMFSSVFGDDGRNLSRLRRISGAKVEVQDCYLGGDGKVIVSGTPDQTLSAQSLLQAFIMAAQ
ncbi:KH domain-containing protein HEN4 isoform X2 [Spinacia oleracea]|uniref:KH domain-containing protein HEN4 isoform X2 n=1 Tax=Spinacia oleracea TaxID=3562 RepID=A0A9R0HYV3_SPIOL|nr:KH domain-containing protein HEN4-like isoform X2 [Spinacia oleracea]